MRSHLQPPAQLSVPLTWFFKGRRRKQKPQVLTRGGRRQGASQKSGPRAAGWASSADGETEDAGGAQGFPSRFPGVMTPLPFLTRGNEERGRRPIRKSLLYTDLCYWDEKSLH